MGILDTLLSMVGLGGSSDDERRETTVSVERDTRTETEAAVKGTDDADDTVAAGTDATASTESPVEEGSATAEPAEAAGPAAEDVETELDTVEAESADETTGEHEAESADETTGEHEAESADETTGEHEATAETERESTEVIKGIGPAYAQRLSTAGIDSVADLAAADAADLAPEVDLSEKRVGRWIDRARDR